MISWSLKDSRPLILPTQPFIELKQYLLGLDVSRLFWLVCHCWFSKMLSNYWCLEENRNLIKDEQPSSQPFSRFPSDCSGATNSSHRKTTTFQMYDFDWCRKIRLYFWGKRTISVSDIIKRNKENEKKKPKRKHIASTPGRYIGGRICRNKTLHCSTQQEHRFQECTKPSLSCPSSEEERSAKPGVASSSWDGEK